MYYCITAASYWHHIRVTHLNFTSQCKYVVIYVTLGFGCKLHQMLSIKQRLANTAVAIFKADVVEQFLETRQAIGGKLNNLLL